MLGRIIRFSCLFLVMCICVLTLSRAVMTSPRTFTGYLRTESYAARTEFLQGGDKSASGFEKIQDDGRYELYLNKSTSSLIISDIVSNVQYFTLASDNPGFDGKYTDESFSEVLITLKKDDTVYKISSGDASLSSRTLIFSDDESGVRIEYTFDIDGGKITLPVRYYLKDNAFFAEADCTEFASVLGDTRILSMSLLKSLGGAARCDDGFIFIPDGCGGVISLDDEDYETDLSVSLNVFGNDLAATGGDLRKTTSSYSSAFSVFGLKTGNNAEFAVIEDGAAQARIKALRPADKNAISFVYPEFEITPVFSSEINKDTGKTITTVGNYSYGGKVSICYRFFSGSSASLSGMSVACRERFIENGTMSIMTPDFENTLPFNMTLIAKDSELEPATSFKEAGVIINRAMGKGIGNINIVYQGLLNPSASVTGYKDKSFDENLGAAADLDELIKKAESSGITLFCDLSLVSLSDLPPGEALKLSSRDIFGGCAATRVQNLEDKNYVNRYLRSLSGISDLIDRLKPASEKYLTSLSIRDAGRYIYSDFNQENPTGRQDAADAIENALQNVSYGRNLMFSGCNQYVLSRADFVTDMPGDVSVQADGYRAVPFLQMVLHGTVQYSHTSFNLAGDFKTAFLRSVEYGAIPAFTFAYSSKEYDIKYTPEAGQIEYTAWLNTAAALYSQANDVLKDLQDLRILDNYEAAKGVNCTLYDGGVKVYVNYNTEEVMVDGIWVPAEGFYVL